jgi:hypothetical protein
LQPFGKRGELRIKIFEIRETAVMFGCKFRHEGKKSVNTI